MDKSQEATIVKLGQMHVHLLRDTLSCTHAHTWVTECGNDHPRVPLR